MTTWHLKTFRDLVNLHCGPADADPAKQAADSVAWKLTLAGYHSDESRHAFAKITPDAVEAAKQLLVVAQGGEAARPFREAAFVSEAHLIACAHALHSTGDILAHAAYFATLPGPTRLPEHRITMPTVMDALRPHATHQAILAGLEAMRTSTAFKYVDAYVNVSKHRRLLNLRASVEFDPAGARHGLRVRPFTYKGDQFPETWSETMTMDYRTELETMIFVVGNELNAFLQGLTRP